MLTIQVRETNWSFFTKLRLVRRWDGRAPSIRPLWGNGDEIHKIKHILRTSRIPRDSHEKFARFNYVFASQFMIYFQTGSECGENEAVCFSRTCLIVSSASATLTCVGSHSTAHSGQAACGMVHWKGGRPTPLFLFFLLLFTLFITGLFIHLHE